MTTDKIEVLRPIDVQVEQWLAGKEQRIRSLAKQTVENVIEIGRELDEAKRDKRMSGGFGEWTKKAFGWSTGSAEKFMGVYALSKIENFSNLETIQLSTLYALTGPSVDEEVVSRAIGAAKSGATVTMADVRRFTVEHTRELLTKRDADIAEIRASLEDINRKVWETDTRGASEMADRVMEGVATALEQAQKPLLKKLDKLENDRQALASRLELEEAKNKGREKVARGEAKQAPNVLVSKAAFDILTDLQTLARSLTITAQETVDAERRLGHQAQLAKAEANAASVKEWLERFTLAMREG